MLTTLACAVCGAGPDPSQSTWVVMSLIISFLPLALLGGIVGWVVHRARVAAREDELVAQKR
jgi:predicted cobalt transporter CbtA